jgi:hypothetical protein
MPDNASDFLAALTGDGKLSLEDIDNLLSEDTIDPEHPPVPETPANPAEPQIKLPDGLDILNQEDLDPDADPNPNPEEDPGENEDHPEDDPETINHFEVFGKGLAELGKLAFEEGEDPEKFNWTEQSFIEKLDQTVENGAWSKLEEIATEALGEEGVKFVEDIFINKVPVRDYLASYQKQQSIEDLDLSKERNQIEVIRYYLKAVVGDDEEEINNQIEYMQANETLEKRAANYQQKLVANEAKMRERLSAEAQAHQKQIEEFEKERTATYSQIVNDAVKVGELNGLPFKKEDMSKVLNSALNKEYTLKNGQKITPFEYKLATMRKDEPAKYLQIVKLVEDGLDLTPVMNKGVTEKTNSIFKGLESKTKTPPSTKKKGGAFSKFLEQI